MVDTTGKSILQQALGSQWQSLPPALQAHYMSEHNKDIGTLDINYPRSMQLLLNVLNFFGALLNRRGKAVPTSVEKYMDGDKQYWKRTITFSDGKEIYFSSRWVYVGGNRLVEYVNPLLGLCMAVNVNEDKLYYEGKHYVINLFGLRLPLPEWLLLGHTRIVEEALDEHSFKMDFRLHHPVSGQVYSYAGCFTTIEAG